MAIWICQALQMFIGQIILFQETKVHSKLNKMLSQFSLQWLQVFVERFMDLEGKK